MKMGESEQQEKIIEVLRRHSGRELHTKRIAELAKLSSSTTAKYLGLLEKDGVVAKREQRPFKFWRLTQKIKKEEGA